MQRSTILLGVAILLVVFLLYRNTTKASPDGKKWTIYGTKGRTNLARCENKKDK